MPKHNAERAFEVLKASVLAVPHSLRTTALETLSPEASRTLQALRRNPTALQKTSVAAARLPLFCMTGRELKTLEKHEKRPSALSAISEARSQLSSQSSFLPYVPANHYLATQYDITSRLRNGCEQTWAAVQAVASALPKEERIEMLLVALRNVSWTWSHRETHSAEQQQTYKCMAALLEVAPLSVIRQLDLEAGDLFVALAFVEKLPASDVLTFVLNHLPQWSLNLETADTHGGVKPVMVMRNLLRIAAAEGRALPPYKRPEVSIAEMDAIGSVVTQAPFQRVFDDVGDAVYAYKVSESEAVRSEILSTALLLENQARQALAELALEDPVLCADLIRTAVTSPIKSYNLLQLVSYKTLRTSAGEDGFLAVVRKAAEQSKPFHGYPDLSEIKPSTAKKIPLSLYRVSSDDSAAALVAHSLAEAFGDDRSAFALGWQMAQEWHGTIVELIDAVRACESSY